MPLVTERGVAAAAFCADYVEQPGPDVRDRRILYGGDVQLLADLVEVPGTDREEADLAAQDVEVRVVFVVEEHHPHLAHAVAPVRRERLREDERARVRPRPMAVRPSRVLVLRSRASSPAPHAVGREVGVGPLPRGIARVEGKAVPEELTARVVGFALGLRGVMTHEPHAVRRARNPDVVGPVRSDRDRACEDELVPLDHADVEPRRLRVEGRRVGGGVALEVEGCRPDAGNRIEVERHLVVEVDVRRVVRGEVRADALIRGADVGTAAGIAVIARLSGRRQVPAAADRVAGIGGAGIAVVAVDGREHAPEQRIAPVARAGATVVARPDRVDASEETVARVVRACILIVAGDRGVAPQRRIARFVRAGISVVLALHGAGERALRRPDFERPPLQDSGVARGGVADAERPGTVGVFTVEGRHRFFRHQGGFHDVGREGGVGHEIRRREHVRGKRDRISRVGLVVPEGPVEHIVRSSRPAVRDRRDRTRRRPQRHLQVTREGVRDERGQSYPADLVREACRRNRGGGRGGGVVGNRKRRHVPERRRGGRGRLRQRIEPQLPAAEDSAVVRQVVRDPQRPDAVRILPDERAEGLLHRQVRHRDVVRVGVVRDDVRIRGPVRDLGVRIRFVVPPRSVEHVVVRPAVVARDGDDRARRRRQGDVEVGAARVGDGSRHPDLREIRIRVRHRDRRADHGRPRRNRHGSRVRVRRRLRLARADRVARALPAPAHILGRAGVAVAAGAVVVRDEDAPDRRVAAVVGAGVLVVARAGLGEHALPGERIADVAGAGVPVVAPAGTGGIACGDGRASSVEGYPPGELRSVRRRSRIRVVDLDAGSNDRAPGDTVVVVLEEHGDIVDGVASLPHLHGTRGVVLERLEAATSTRCEPVVLVRPARELDRPAVVTWVRGILARVEAPQRCSVGRAPPARPVHQIGEEMELRSRRVGRIVVSRRDTVSEGVHGHADQRARHARVGPDRGRAGPAVEPGLAVRRADDRMHLVGRGSPDIDGQTGYPRVYPTGYLIVRSAPQPVRPGVEVGDPAVPRCSDGPAVHRDGHGLGLRGVGPDLNERPVVQAHRAVAVGRHHPRAVAADGDLTLLHVAGAVPERHSETDGAELHSTGVEEVQGRRRPRDDRRAGRRRRDGAHVPETRSRPRDDPIPRPDRVEATGRRARIHHRVVRARPPLFLDFAVNVPAVRQHVVRGQEDVVVRLARDRDVLLSLARCRRDRNHASGKSSRWKNELSVDIPVAAPDGLLLLPDDLGESARAMRDVRIPRVRHAGRRDWESRSGRGARGSHVPAVYLPERSPVLLPYHEIVLRRVLVGDTGLHARIGGRADRERCDAQSGSGRGIHPAPLDVVGGPVIPRHHELVLQRVVRDREPKEGGVVGRRAVSILRSDGAGGIDRSAVDGPQVIAVVGIHHEIGGVGSAAAWIRGCHRDVDAAGVTVRRNLHREDSADQRTVGIEPLSNDLSGRPLRGNDALTARSRLGQPASCRMRVEAGS